MPCAGLSIPDSALLGQTMTLLLLTDALHKMEGGGLGLNAALMDIQPHLLHRRRQWFCCADATPLGWYAALVGTSPAALLAARCSDISASARQCWVASPYHAQLGRDTIRLMPEGSFPWSEADSIWMCDLLNPLLLQEGMSLHACGAALLLACNTPLDAAPLPFAAISGGLLPNRHPQGPDGGRLMRLMAEIQMSLHDKPQPTRSAQPQVHGLWLWGASALPAILPANLPPVATRNPFLQSLQHEHGAGVMISETERLSEALSSEVLPKAVVLAGGGHAVCLHKSLLPRFSKGWQAKSPATQAELFVRINRMLDAT